MIYPDFFGLSDRVKRLTPPDGYEDVHRDGYSWAKQGTAYQDTTKLGADDWNQLIANFRALLSLADVIDQAGQSDPRSPYLLRDVVSAYCIAKITELLPAAVTDNAEAIAPYVDVSAFDFLSKSGGTMTGALMLAADPTSALHAATKQYVDGIALNLGKRGRVRVRTTANVNLATGLAAGATIDGVALSAGDQVLVMAQTTAAQNGVYDVPATGAASRTAEFDSFAEHPGSLIAVQEGAAYADTLWLCTSNKGGTLGTTAINFAAVMSLANILAALGYTPLNAATVTLTDANNAALGSFASFNGTNDAAAAANLPDLGAGSTLMWWNIETFGSSNRIAQIATQAFGNGYQNRTFRRAKHDAAWSAWTEVYTNSSPQIKEAGTRVYSPNNPPAGLIGFVGINDQTGTTYTAALADAGKLIRFNNAAAIAFTVPPNSGVAFPVGTIIGGTQLGAGQVTITPGSGVTINNADGLKSGAQYGQWTLTKTATDTWLASGRLIA